MLEHTEDKQSIVARLNALEAQYTDAHSASSHTRHLPTGKRYKMLGKRMNR